MKSVLMLIFIMLTGTCLPQNMLEDIDLDRIPQKKIRILIKHQLSDNKILNFNQLQATYHTGQSLTGYHMLKSVYRVRETPEKVWRAYQITSPAQSWNGRMISFGLLISKWKSNILYRNDSYFAGIDTGQVFYINLKILKGLYNLAVGLEIMNVDPVGRCINFSYLQGGISRGEQIIRFLPTRNGHTKIIHLTAFKSNSYLRDRYLYPYFHRIAINEFHRNMKKCIPRDEILLSSLHPEILIP